jgi:hypothetical protein
MADDHHAQARAGARRRRRRRAPRARTTRQGGKKKQPAVDLRHELLVPKTSVLLLNFSGRSKDGSKDG